MFLDTTSRKIQIVLTALKTANDMPVTVDYVDMSATATTSGLQLSTTNGTTAVDILSAPPASTQRKINGITVCNKDTAAKTVQVSLVDGATVYPLVYFTLQVNDTLGYTDTGGWYVDDTSGARKVVFSSANYLSKASGVFTIGAANCDYTSIQTALTANPLANALFLVYPGTYNDTINFTANGQCVVGMGTGEQQIITSASSTIINCAAFTTCFVRNITATMTAATTAAPLVTLSTGQLDFDDAYLNVTNSTVTAATQPSIASITGSGTIDFSHSDMTYTNNVSDGTGVTAIKAAFLPGNGAILGSLIDVTMAGAGQSLGHTLSFTSGSGYSSVTRSNVKITDAASSVVAGYYASGTGVLGDLEYCDFYLTGGAAASVIFMYLTGTVTVGTDFCDVSCIGGLTNYSGNIGAGCTWNSTLDGIVAASGYTGAGTINYASSPALGQYRAAVITATTGFQGGTGTASAQIPISLASSAFNSFYGGGITNGNSGAAAYAIFQVANNLGSASTLAITSGGFTPSGVFLTDQSRLHGTGAGGVLIYANNGTGVIDFATIATRAGRITSAQNWLFGSGTTDSGAAKAQFGAGTTALAQLQFSPGSLLNTPAAGIVHEFDGASFYDTIDTSSGRGQVPVRQNFHLTVAGGAITTIANFFGATSNISLVANAYYEIEVVCFFLKTTADTVVWTLTNSAAPTGQNIQYEMSPITGIVAPPGTATLLSGQAYNDTTAAYNFTTGTLTTGVNHYAKFKIQLKNGTGTSLKIQATATTGSVTPGIGSYWTCTRMPAGNTGTFSA